VLTDLFYMSLPVDHEHVFITCTLVHCSLKIEEVKCTVLDETFVKKRLPQQFPLAGIDNKMWKDFSDEELMSQALYDGHCLTVDHRRHEAPR